MKFIYLSDSHIKGKNPENRIGDYYKDVMSKIAEIVDLSEKYKVDYVFHGGDVFNSPYVSNIIIDEFIDLIESAKIHWHIIRGNHDEIGNNPLLSQSSSLDHVFRRSKYIHHLDYLNCTDKYNNCTDKYNKLREFVQGFDYYHGIETDIKEKGLIYKNEDINIKKIAIVHAFLTPKPFLSHVLHVQLKDIICSFDYVLCSHLHLDWGKLKVGKTTYINLGAIGRQGIDEVNKQPKILLVDTKKDTCDIIKLKSAKKGIEVFDIEKLEKMKSHEENIDKFVQGLTDLKLKSLDIRGKIEEIARLKNIDKVIIDLAIKKVSQFEEEKNGLQKGN